MDMQEDPSDPARRSSSTFIKGRSNVKDDSCHTKSEISVSESNPLQNNDENCREDRKMNLQQSTENDILLSHIVPPSHILPDGRFIRLPPPTPLDHAAFFERSVASHRLISADTDADSSVVKHILDSGEIQRSKKKSKKNVDSQFVHPLAIASARLRGKGIDELSKAINLGGLVVGGEYFGLTNVVNQRLIVSKKSSDDNASERENMKNNGTNENGNINDSTTAIASSDGMVLDESLRLDQRLRSLYVLKQCQAQYQNSSTVLSRHLRRLSSSISARRILDSRLQSLRRRWRLVAPEHGTRTIGPVRPREVVAIDVEVYDRDRLGGGSRAIEYHSPQVPGQIGHIARCVPRFATIELDNDYDLSIEIRRLRNEIKDKMNSLIGNPSNNVKRSAFIVNDVTSELEIDDIVLESNRYKTKAEPFVIADPTLGKIDPDFDPEKVPLLTLLFEIEKPSTGFLQRTTLSSSFTSSTGNDTRSSEKEPPHDERVIEALQHSLFCASLFESMRAEIIPPFTQSDMPIQLQNKSMAWLSSEMEESFLPSPTAMAGQYRNGATRSLCVIYCHEGEVKVQMNHEYSLTVKLIEAGTAAAVASADNPTTQESNGINRIQSSGSQSPDQLQTLCKALLLHSQTLYHEHCMKTKLNVENALKIDINESLSLVRTKQESKHISPNILQSCVGLGCKLILEKKVRAILTHLSEWLQLDMKCNIKIMIEWLPLAMFDSHSQFVLAFLECYYDIGIFNDTLRVTQTCDSQEYKSVDFGSELELECFLKKEFRRALADK